MVDVEHDGRAVARLRILHVAPALIFPDRLVTVGVLAAGHALAPREDAALELALVLQRLAARIDLTGGEIAAAARRAELQHEGDRSVGVALWAVGRAFGEIAEAARGHLAVAGEVGDALDLKAELIEIVPVPRRREVALNTAEVELEVAQCAGAAGQQRARMESAAAIFETALPLDFVGMSDLHRPSSRAVRADLYLVAYKLAGRPRVKSGDEKPQ